MFFSILTPEVTIVWALKQWRGAIVIRNAVTGALKEAFPDSRKIDDSSKQLFSESLITFQR